MDRLDQRIAHFLAELDRQDNIESDDATQAALENLRALAAD